VCIAKPEHSSLPCEYAHIKRIQHQRHELEIAKHFFNFFQILFSTGKIPKVITSHFSTIDNKTTLQHAHNESFQQGNGHVSHNQEKKHQALDLTTISSREGIPDSGSGYGENSRYTFPYFHPYKQPHFVCQSWDISDTNRLQHLEYENNE
jgi:hypothetical protein